MTTAPTDSAPLGLRRLTTVLATLCCLAVGSVEAADAIQVTGVLGSPSATTTIPGDQLPPPAPAFGGKIERNALQSKVIPR